ncbi:MAG: FAD-binding oxidoreductase [Micrococcales bacterium]|nr:FAD-binding oxidoreductase [Micrococcales bacterium]
MPLAALPDEDVEFVLSDRTWCTPVVAELTLTVAERALDFRPGQYVLLQDEARTVAPRSYSIANAPRSDDTLTILVTAVPDGPTSTWLTRDATVGHRLLVSGPYGNFVADPDHVGPTLYLAGGSGLAPVRALIEAAALRGATGVPEPARRHTLLFSGRTAADVIHSTWLTELARTQPGFDYVRTLTRAAAGEADPPVGRVPEVLPGLLPDLTDHAVYIAGAPGFVEACTRTAEGLGVRAGRLHTEEFYAEPAPWHAEPTPASTTASEEIP